MTRTFKVGDRVRVYHGWREIEGQVTSIANTNLASELIHVTEDGFYSAHEDGPFAPEQCRKLVKKERRRVWLIESDIPASKGINYHKTIYRWPERHNNDNWIEFIEAKRKERV